VVSLDQVEQLKREWTDRYVVVTAGIPELRRFASRTGQVKTVNMNGRALVQFDSSEDISWYDIDLSCLKTVDAPAKKKEKAAEVKPTAEAPKSGTPAKPAAAEGGKKLSPLEQARKQGAAGSKSAAPAAKPAAEGGKKLSPLEQARQQGAAGSSGAKPAASPSAPSPAAAASGKKLSPLELARQQGAAGSGGSSPAAQPAAPPADEPAQDEPEESAEAESATEEAPAEPEPQQKPSTPATAPDGRKLSPLELARQQGPFKG
jgi:hypothetical protein